VGTQNSSREPPAATTALVLGGGGIAGHAWMLGLADGLRARGLDLGDVQLIVGTSAGARAGAQLATGVLDDVVGKIRRSELAEIDAPVQLDEFVGAAMRAIAGVTDDREAARRIANIEPLGTSMASETERKAVIAAHLPIKTWPQRSLAIMAVDAESGRLVRFDARSGVELIDAVAASSALPGVWPLATINGRRYADGGARSVFNADFAAGHANVILVSPTPLNDYLRVKLDTEVATLGTATVHIIFANDESLAAIGPNPLSTHARIAALDAGAAQANQELERLRVVFV
jgi:NTE family protein